MEISLAGKQNGKEETEKKTKDMNLKQERRLDREFSSIQKVELKQRAN